MLTRSPNPAPPVTYHDARLVKRYVFDLNEVVADLKGIAGLKDEDEELARTWILNHLCEMHYIDVTPMGPMPYEIQRDLHTKIDARCERFSQAVTSSLWHVLNKMSVHVCNSTFFNITFRHDILSVAVYD